MRGWHLPSRSIAPTAVRDYAKSRGWKMLEGVPRRLWVFCSPENELRQVTIPMEKGDDYVDALREAALRLAENERRPMDAIINDILVFARRCAAFPHCPGKT